ncbi:hypothetical protein BGY98DRAFT_974215, partial [Russula aff. rugulosa BPL654]
MEKLWTDEVIIETVWKNFMSKLLQNGRRDSMANVGFLAIPGVVLSNISGTG